MKIQIDTTCELCAEEREFIANVEWVLNAEPIIRLSGSEFEKSEIDLITQVSDYFNSIGGKVYRENFGVVILNHRGAKDSIAHGLGRAKAAAFKAVPSIIQHGKIIDYQQNWKGRGYSTYVFDAPIVIGEIDYIAEVIVERNKNNGRNTFYLHEVETKERARSVFETATERGTPQAKRDVFKTATERGTPKNSKLVIVKNILKLTASTNNIIHFCTLSQTFV